MDKKTEIKKQLKERNLFHFASDYAKMVSNNRVSKISKLTDSEAEKLLMKIKEMTPEFLIGGIYSICKDLGVKIGSEKSEASDMEIINYCKQLMTIEQINKVCFKLPLSKMPYEGLLVLSAFLGNTFLQWSAQMN